MSERKPLKLCDDQRLTLAAELDEDGDLLVESGCDCFWDRYLTIDEMTALRGHLDSILKEHEEKQECAHCNWPARIGHHADCPYRTDFS